MQCTSSPHTDVSWSKGKLVGQKAPLKPREVWAIRSAANRDRTLLP